MDTGLGPEMKSTGEVLGLAETYPQALLKAFKGAGLKVPKRGSRIIVTVKDEDKAEMVGIARGFEEMGVEIYATSGTCDALTEAGIQCKRVNRVSQSHPNILDMIQSGTVDLIINTPTKGRKQDSDGFKIRRSAVEHSVACVTAIDSLGPGRCPDGPPRLLWNFLFLDRLIRQNTKTEVPAMKFFQSARRFRSAIVLLLLASLLIWRHFFALPFIWPGQSVTLTAYNGETTQQKLIYTWQDMLKFHFTLLTAGARPAQLQQHADASPARVWSLCRWCPQRL